MKYTKDSELLIYASLNNKCTPFVKNSNKTDTIFKQLYLEMVNAKNYLDSMKKKKGNNFIH
jgi:hypothetical protein